MQTNSNSGSWRDANEKYRTKNGKALVMAGIHLRFVCSVNNHIHLLCWIWWWKCCHMISMATVITKLVKLHNNDFVPHIAWIHYVVSQANLQGLAYPAGPLIPVLLHCRDPYVMVLVYLTACFWDQLLPQEIENGTGRIDYLNLVGLTT